MKQNVDMIKVNVLCLKICRHQSLIWWLGNWVYRWRILY